MESGFQKRYTLQPNRMKHRHTDKAQAADLSELRQRVAELETRARGTTLAAILSGVGAVLSGLGSIGADFKPTQSPPPPSAPVQQYEHHEHDRTPRVDRPAGPTPGLDSFVSYLDQSDLHRSVFAYALRESHRTTTSHVTEKNSPELLRDSSEPDDIRVIAALYAGAYGLPSAASDLEAFATANGVVGRAANVGLKMIKEEPKLTFWPEAGSAPKF